MPLRFEILAAVPSKDPRDRHLIKYLVVSNSSFKCQSLSLPVWSWPFGRLCSLPCFPCGYLRFLLTAEALADIADGLLTSDFLREVRLGRYLPLAGSWGQEGGCTPLACYMSLLEPGRPMWTLVCYPYSAGPCSRQHLPSCCRRCNGTHASVCSVS